MAILQALIAAIIHSLGRILNTIFGWATALLFGHVTAREQVLMSITSFGSMLWLLALVGIAFPTAGMWLVTAVVPPDVAHYRWAIRIAMLGGLVLIPFLVGGSLLLVEGSKEGSSLADKAARIGEGWPYTVGLSLTMLLMIVLAPIMKVRTLMRKWVTQHIPIMIPCGQYTETLEDIERILDKVGIKTYRQPASWMLRLPTRILSLFAKNQMNRRLAEQLTVLVGDDFKLLVHPSDLIIAGPKKRVGFLRAFLSEKLAFTHVYMTWDSKANELERQLRLICLNLRTGRLNYQRVLDKLREVEDKMRRDVVSFEEWEVLFREKLQIEHELLERQCLRDFGEQKGAA